MECVWGGGGMEGSRRMENYGRKLGGKVEGAEEEGKWMEKKKGGRGRRGDKEEGGGGKDHESRKGRRKG